MRALLAAAALGAALVASAPLAAEPGEDVSDLVTPAGRVLRALEVEKVAGAGSRVTYAAAGRDAGALAADAAALVEAVGPQLAAAGETAVTVRALHRGAARELAFTLRDGTFVPAPSAPPAWTPIAGPPAPPRVGTDREAVARTAAAAAAGARWLLLLDDGRGEAAVEEAAAPFREEIRATGQWRALMERRRAVRYPARRVERYRLQTLAAPGAGGATWRVAVQYDTRSADGARFQERVTLVEEGGGWRVAGYGLREAGPGGG